MHLDWLPLRPLAFVIVVMAVLVPFMSSAPATPSNTWTSVAPLLHSRYGLAAATGRDGRIYAIGGAGSVNGYAGYALKDVEVYTPADNQWTKGAPMPTARRNLAATLGPDGRIYAAGGMNDPKTPDTSNGNIFIASGMSTVEAYDPQTNAWTTIAPMPTPRLELGLVTGNDGLIYAIGGCPGIQTSCVPVLGTVEAYNPATNTWTTKASMPTPRGGGGGTLGPDGLIYVMGGLTVADGPVVNTVEAYNPSTNKWKTVASMPTARFVLAATTGPDGRVYAIGGGYPGPPTPFPLDTVEAYSPATKTWTQLSPIPVARPALAATSSGGRIYAIGGEWCRTCPDTPKNGTDKVGAEVDSYTP